MSVTRTESLKQVIMRHRMTILDVLLLVAALGSLLLLALEFDLFRSPGSPEQKSLEADELLLLSTCLLFGLLVLGWRFVMAQRKEIARRLLAERRAHDLAMLDSLTGLANRRQFDLGLKAAVAAAPGTQAVHAAFMIDLNGFKKINDAFGHGIGDEVLIHVAIRLKEVVREPDLVARIGGDEFAVIARHLGGPEEAATVALRIMREIECPVTIGSHNHQVGAGIGIALMPRDGNTGEELLRKADIALYRAKAERKSAMCFFEPEMDASLREREFFEKELSKAVRANAIGPFYQPLVELATRKVIGFEALARWVHPELGDIPPERFIPIAESAGVMSELTDQLLRQACQDACQWPEDTTLAFNISPSQLYDQTLALRLLTILGETGLSPRRLELELTESALVKDLDRAKELLGALRTAGIRLALDDFGTGYSTLHHLRSFQVDKIKVDRSFVDNMKDRPEAAALVRAIVGLGTGLGLTVTAEGVENDEQMATLLADGCQQGQGFLFSRAVSAEEAIELVKQGQVAGQAA